jgi:3'-phosphoadenosine 5'-phosphosulfate sulfotransferase
MMMVKVEVREFRLKQIIEELEPTKAKLQSDSDMVSEG